MENYISDSFCDIKTYSNFNFERENKMSCIVVTQVKDTFFIASDSYNTFFNRDGLGYETPISTNTSYKKIYPCKNSIIATYGISTFNQKEIYNFIETEKEYKRDDLLTLIEVLKPRIFIGAETGIILLTIENGKVVFYNALIGAEYYQLVKRDCLRFSFTFGTIYSNKLKATTLGETPRLLREFINVNSACSKIAENVPLVGGKVQMFSINSTGFIEDLSEN